ncbi:putative lipid II flippase FtsW [Candidatus Saganbacteria bacterium]|nr:putative lipid II flippase FtsW [Candidatus Saganbacteria bacterium]
MKKRPGADKPFLALTLALILFGTIMIFSSSPVMGIKVGDSFYYLKHHLLYLILGFFAFVLAMNLEMPKLKRFALPILSLSVFFLFMLFIPRFGTTLGGATRWLNLYLFSFQPSELVKFAMVLYFSMALSNIKDKVGDFMKGLLPLLLILIFVVAIIIKQPDLGTALSILGTSFIMLFIAGARIAHLTVLAAVGAFAVLIISILSPYKLKRLVAYLDPWKDPLGVGFHIIQSLLAVGSGGIFGLGLGNSRQKFYYLPQQYADFIFAVLCEELGFIGAIALLLIFVLFFLRGMHIAKNAPDSFSSLLAFGLILMFFVQAALNLLVVVGLIPTTGIPLPFVSYGGTAMIINLFSVGIIANISRLKK